MKQRPPVFELANDLRIIVEGIFLSPRSISKLELSRKYGGPTIDRLIDEGHLAEGITEHSTCIIVTPLTIRELENYFTRSWNDEEDSCLKKAWSAGQPIMEIASRLDRAGGNVLARAWEIGVARGRWDKGFGSNIPAWRVTRLRSSLIDAEKRGLDLNDDGEGLEHRAALRRFAEARK
ncbi:MAG: hypothetical protein GY835_19815, partial [bacterium]|nr:hypothetical protein [bacterium]